MSTVDSPAAPRTELQLIGESAAQAAPILSTEPAAPAVPAVPELLVRHACSSSSSSADGPSTLGQLFAIGSRAELLPLTFPGIRGRHSSGGIVDILYYDARTALYTVTPVIRLARPRGGIAEERLANYCLDGGSSFYRQGRISGIGARRVVQEEGEAIQALQQLEREWSAMTRALSREKQRSTHDLASVREQLRVQYALSAKDWKRKINQMEASSSSAQRASDRLQATSVEEIFVLKQISAEKSKRLKAAQAAIKKHEAQKEARAITVRYKLSDTARQLELAQRQNVSLSQELESAHEVALSASAQASHMRELKNTALSKSRNVSRSLAKLEKSNENRQSLWLKVSSKEMPPGVKEGFARLNEDVSHATVEADARGEECAELREEVLMLRARLDPPSKAQFDKLVAVRRSAPSAPRLLTALGNNNELYSQDMIELGLTLMAANLTAPQAVGVVRAFANFEYPDKVEGTDYRIPDKKTVSRMAGGFGAYLSRHQPDGG